MWLGDVKGAGEERGTDHLWDDGDGGAEGVEVERGGWESVVYDVAFG